MTTSPAPALSVQGVSHAFGAAQALKDVSLEARAGAFVALLGINGAGKTTLFSLITRLYDNVSGSIEVCGHDVRRAPGPALAQLGVVFQSRTLDASLTVRQNMIYHGSLHGLGRAEAVARAEALLERAGLSDKVDARAGSLSGGQSRRVEIARALLHEPKLLLLDEPTVGLDVRSRRGVSEIVRALVAEEGVGVLWATHLFDEIEPSDDVVLLHKGEVLAADSAGAIADGRALSQVFLEMTGVDVEALA